MCGEKGCTPWPTVRTGIKISRCLFVSELKVLGTTHRLERFSDVVTTSGGQNGNAKRLQEARELQARGGEDVNV